jgi:transcriptional regulator with XRE-family HTH domain
MGGALALKIALSALGMMVRKKRSARKLREVAKEIGITAPTLMRIEAGRVPDVATFGKVCLWLGVDSGDFLGHPARTVREDGDTLEPAVRVSAHFKADQLPLPETATALARMLLYIAQKQSASSLKIDDGDA